MKRITTYSRRICRPVGRGAAGGISKKLIVCELVVVVVIKLKSTSGWFYGDEATPGLRQPLQQGPGTVTTSNARHTAMDPSAGNPGKKYMGILPTGKRPGQGRRLAAWSVRSAVCALRWHHRVRGLFSSLRRLSVMWDRPSLSTQEPGDCGGRLHGGVVLQVGIPSAQELICDGLS